jgi:hypothetical protein
MQVVGWAEQSEAQHLITLSRLLHQTQFVLSHPNQHGKSRFSQTGESWNISIPSGILPTRVSPGCNVYTRHVVYNPVRRVFGAPNIGVAKRPALFYESG